MEHMQVIPAVGVNAQYTAWTKPVIAWGFVLRDEIIGFVLSDSHDGAPLVSAKSEAGFLHFYLQQDDV